MSIARSSSRFAQASGSLPEVERREGGRDVGLEVEEAAPVDLVVEHRVPGRPLLHELGEEAGLVERVPLRGQRREEPVAQGAAAPVGDHLPLVGLDHVRRHRVARLRPRVEDAQVLEAVAGQLGERGHGLRGRAALADDQLALAEVDRLLLAEVEERAGAHHRDRPAAVVLAVEAGEEDGALGRDRGRRLEAAAAQGFGAGVHGVSLRSARRGRARGRARRGSRVARATAGRARRARTRGRGGGPWARRSGGRGGGSPGGRPARPATRAAVAARSASASVWPGTTGTRIQTSAWTAASARRFVEDRRGREAGERAVARVVHELHVEQEQVDERGEREQALARREAAGVDGGVDPGGAAGLEERRAGTPAGRAARRRRT